MALNISLYVNVEDMSFWIKYHFQKHLYVCFLCLTLHLWTALLMLLLMLKLMWQLNCIVSMLQICIQLFNRLQWVRISHLKSLTDSWVKHHPIHPAIHSDSADKEILLFNLLLTQSEVNRWLTGGRGNLRGKEGFRKSKFTKTYIFKDT